MNCFVCGNPTLKGAAIHETCKRIQPETDDDEKRIALNELKVSMTTKLIVGIYTEANARSELRPIEKISGKKK